MRADHTCRRCIEIDPRRPACPCRSVIACDALLGDQFEAPECNPPSTLIGTPASIDAMCIGTKVHAEIRLAACDPLRLVDAWVALHVADIGEALGAQQFPGEIQACPAVGATDPPRQTNGGRFQRRLTVSASVVEPTRPAAPAAAAPARKRRRFCMICIRTLLLPNCKRQFWPEPSKRGFGRGRWSRERDE